MNVVEADALRFRYGTDAPEVLSGVGFVVRAGERVALVGPSGCGKTTLLRLLEGSLDQDAGTIQRRGSVAMVYQDQRLISEASVLDNVLYGALNQDRREVRGRAADLLEDVGLASMADRLVGSLSGGQRQRVAIARALVGRPKALLADEPFANLDRSTAERIWNLLVDLQARHGFALVCSVHDPSMAERFDRQVELCAADCPLRCGEQSQVSAQPKLRVSWAWGAGLALLTAWAAWDVFAGGPGPVQAMSQAGELLAKAIPSGLQELREIRWDRLSLGMLETLKMALLGTVIGAGASLPLALLAAPPGKRGVVGKLAIGVSNVVRSVPSLLWALLAVAAVGIGPAAGVAALAAYSCGYLTRLFLDELENADARPAESLMRLGATRWQAMRFGLLKPCAPGLLGSGLFVFEYNVRGASVLGLVGAGGIGAELIYLLEWRQMPAFAIGLIWVIATVWLLDAFSRQVRVRLAARRGC